MPALHSRISAGLAGRLNRSAAVLTEASAEESEGEAAPPAITDSGDAPAGSGGGDDVSVSVASAAVYLTVADRVEAVLNGRRGRRFAPPLATWDPPVSRVADIARPATDAPVPGHRLVMETVSASVGSAEFLFKRRSKAPRGTSAGGGSSSGRALESRGSSAGALPRVTSASAGLSQDSVTLLSQGGAAPLAASPVAARPVSRASTAGAGEGGGGGAKRVWMFDHARGSRVCEHMFGCAARRVVPAACRCPGRPWLVSCEPQQVAGPVSLNCRCLAVFVRARAINPHAHLCS